MKKNMTYEDAIIALEDTVKRLESGSLSINDSLKEFEAALELVRFCNKVLEDAEQKVSLLTKQSDGTVSGIPFGEVNEA